MADDKFLLGTDNSSLAKSAANVIREAIRKGGRVGIVEQPNLVTHPNVGDTRWYPAVGTALIKSSTVSNVTDIVTGQVIAKTPVIYPCVALLPSKLGIDGSHIVFYGTTGYLRRLK